MQHTCLQKGQSWLFFLIKTICFHLSNSHLQRQGCYSILHNTRFSESWSWTHWRFGPKKIWTQENRTQNPPKNGFFVEDEGLKSERILFQTHHIQFFSSVWIFWCTVRFFLCLKTLLQSLHPYGFSPVWILWWPTKFLLEVKDFLHFSHSYGFSPVCILWCTTRFLFWLKSFPHSLHL